MRRRKWYCDAGPDVPRSADGTNHPAEFSHSAGIEPGASEPVSGQGCGLFRRLPDPGRMAFEFCKNNEKNRPFAFFLQKPPFCRRIQFETTTAGCISVHIRVSLFIRG